MTSNSHTPPTSGQRPTKAQHTWITHIAPTTALRTFDTAHTGLMLLPPPASSLLHHIMCRPHTAAATSLPTWTQHRKDHMPLPPAAAGSPAGAGALLRMYKKYVRKR